MIKSCGVSGALRPDRLAGATPGARRTAPAVGKRRDQQQAASALAVRRRAGGEEGDALPTGVGDLDPYGAGRRGGRHVHLEVPAGDVPVLDGVGAQLCGHECDDVMGVAVVRDAPGVEAVLAQAAGEAGTARGGAEAHREPVHRDG